MDNTTAELVSQLTASQNRLQGYIFTLTADREATQDILQSTNLVIWDKADEFVSGTNFVAWAFQIARYQVLAYRKKQMRCKLVFSDELVAELAEVMATDNSDEWFQARQAALTKCLEGISARNRDLFLLRYRNGLKMRDIANQIGKTASAVEKMVARLRGALLRCVEARLQEEAAP
ncbi:sigma-70 family RNA polymerase sigma factor [Aeoliella sp. ICT_H6.2]|uniref:Sigma-70 family RNA polymerase sigma factor n=1 Tax=Aeoliella straminimaris TaxID=2954799 RepID=A0A9X2JG91_9BACT|nr:sigma-70 family RNA polymerase sigma factor [Aeoliella straminimaris]MCO6043273.1 sigma-70 family RNA polymerase sigma factor [Aeoliella straminimaris]